VLFANFAEAMAEGAGKEHKPTIYAEAGNDGKIAYYCQTGSED